MLEIQSKMLESNQIFDSSTNIMKYLIQDLLDYAQIKAGKFNQKVKQFDVKQAIYDVVEIQKHKAKS